jgi:DNA-binding transcriptional MocR family regulator
MIDWVKCYFPEGTKMSYPQGGFLLWVELPKKIKSIELNERLARENISIAPGILFTASDKYQHCLRLNYSQVPNEDIRKAVETVGSVAKTLL